MNDCENYQDQSRHYCNKRAQIKFKTKRAKIMTPQTNEQTDTSQHTTGLLQYSKLTCLNDL